MTDSTDYSSRASTSLEELRRLVDSGTQDDEKLAGLQRIRGEVRSLLSENTLLEPPNFNGWIFIKASLQEDKSFSAQEVNWYPNQTQACADFMITAAGMFDKVPSYENAANTLSPWTLTDNNFGGITIWVKRLSKDEFQSAKEEVEAGKATGD